MNTQAPTAHTPNPTVITRIRQALWLSRLCIMAGWLAIASFLVGGSLMTLKAYHDTTLAKALVTAVPYALVGMTIPISVYLLWLSWRYQIVQATILMTVLCLAMGLFSVKVIWAMVAWLAMPYLFRVNLARYLDFLLGKPSLSSRRQRKNKKIRTDA